MKLLRWQALEQARDPVAFGQALEQRAAEGNLEAQGGSYLCRGPALRQRCAQRRGTAIAKRKCLQVMCCSGAYFALSALQNFSFELLNRFFFAPAAR